MLDFREIQRLGAGQEHQIDKSEYTVQLPASALAVLDNAVESLNLSLASRRKNGSPLDYGYTIDCTALSYLKRALMELKAKGTLAITPILVGQRMYDSSFPYEEKGVVKTKKDSGLAGLDALLSAIYPSPEGNQADTNALSFNRAFSALRSGRILVIKIEGAQATEPLAA